MRHLDRQGALSGSADPNPGVDLANSFWVLMLDQSQDITGFQSGTPEGTTRTRTMDVGGEHYRGRVSGLRGQARDHHRAGDCGHVPVRYQPAAGYAARE